MSKPKNGRNFGALLFFIVAVICMIAAVLPAITGRGVNAVFLGVGATFLVIGIAATRRQRGAGDSEGRPPA